VVKNSWVDQLSQMHFALLGECLQMHDCLVVNECEFQSHNEHIGDEVWRAIALA
jgi:hypothetical protein